MISSGLSLPAVITVVDLDKLHVLKVMSINRKILCAGPAMKLRAAFKFAAQAAMRANHFSCHKITPLFTDSFLLYDKADDTPYDAPKAMRARTKVAHPVIERRSYSDAVDIVDIAS